MQQIRTPDDDGNVNSWKQQRVLDQQKRQASPVSKGGREYGECARSVKDSIVINIILPERKKQVWQRRQRQRDQVNPSKETCSTTGAVSDCNQSRKSATYCKNQINEHSQYGLRDTVLCIEKSMSNSREYQYVYTTTALKNTTTSTNQKYSICNSVSNKESKYYVTVGIMTAQPQLPDEDHADNGASITSTSHLWKYNSISNNSMSQQQQSTSMQIIYDNAADMYDSIDIYALISHESRGASIQHLSVIEDHRNTDTRGAAIAILDSTYYHTLVTLRVERGCMTDRNSEHSSEVPAIIEPVQSKYSSLRKIYEEKEDRQKTKATKIQLSSNEVSNQVTKNSKSYLLGNGNTNWRKGT